jgi:hypothetical protein
VASLAETRGHGTTGLAKFWSAQLERFMDALPGTAIVQ